MGLTLLLHRLRVRSIKPAGSEWFALFRITPEGIILLHNHKNNMKKLKSITAKREIDTDADLSFLGTFSDTKGRFAVKHSDGPRTLKWFNADNVSNMKDARLQYKDMMEFENGNRSMMGVFAVAKLLINGTIQTIRSAGLWGIDSSSDEKYFNDIEIEEVFTLIDMLRELGFTEQEIEAVSPFVPVR
jgi:hypothetical protein